MIAAFAAVIPLFGFVAGGCADPEDQGPPAPRVVKFEGAVDSRYFGNWLSTDKRQGLDLVKDGSAKILSTQMGPGGGKKSKFDGQWLIMDDSLILKYLDSTKKEQISKYNVALSGNTLTLSMLHGKIKTKYLRQP